VTSFGQVAPLALMSGSIELLQAWVIETLGALAGDEHNAGCATRCGFPAGERQPQDHRGTSHAAQEHGPVPGAQGRGRARAARQRAPPAH
jgi:hypothetical protein